jgi:hypothetical protein
MIIIDKTKTDLRTLFVMNGKERLATLYIHRLPEPILATPANRQIDTFYFLRLRGKAFAFESYDEASDKMYEELKVVPGSIEQRIYSPNILPGKKCLILPGI